MTTRSTATGDAGLCQSMTGFARGEGRHEAFAWVFEIRSVNNRGFDWRSRLPSGFEDFDVILCKQAQTLLTRGSLSVTLTLKRDQADAGIRLNEAALSYIVETLPTLASRIPAHRPPSLDGLLGLRGVIETDEPVLEAETRKALLNALQSGFDDTLNRLISARREEGARLHHAMGALVDEIARLHGEAGGLATGMQDRLRDRLETQLDELLADRAIAEDRLAQEVALLAVKADIREEIDRLSAHIDAARDLLKRGTSIGREFDFLVQEFNREANTLCAKAPFIELKQVGLSMKTVIDQLREQIQNVE